MQIRPRKLISLLLVASVAGGFYTSARPDRSPEFSAAAEAQTPPARSDSGTSQTDSKLVYMRADHSYSIDVGDSMAVCMVGNFAALHNGAVITCDSAVRYDAQTIECFGNVLINQNTTYIYGDRADYRGRINKAEVYSPLVKVIDGDATLYTFRFTFDTYEKVGEFSGGGVLFNRGNQLEAERGYYFTETHEISCVGRVEMQDSTYQLSSDSVIYATDFDRADFFSRTNIWNVDGDYLYGDRGNYQRPQELYVITENGYVLTAKEELWSDSLDYYRNEEHLLLYRNIQIDDTEHKTLAFGDYGEYWKNPGNALLTRRPSLVGYDTSQGDTVFMRSDTILLVTTFTTQRDEPAPEAASEADRSAGPAAADSLPRPKNDREPDAPGRLGGRDSLRGKVPTPAEATADLTERTAGEPDSEFPAEGAAADSLIDSRPDSIVRIDDSLTHARDSLTRLRDSLDTLSVKARKAFYKAQKKKELDAEKQRKAEARRVKLRQIARARQAKLTAQLNRMEEAEQRRLARRRERLEAKLAAKRERAIRKGKELPDSSALSRLDSLLIRPEAADSLETSVPELSDTLSAADTLAAPVADSLIGETDTVRRIAKGFRNVKIYRSDFQAVCDSIVGLGVDSTLHLYIDPVLWNEKNQVTSDVMDVYTVSQQVDHIDFVGRPIMITEIDTLYFNQISGKEMTAWFAANEIYRHDVNGNVETIYFLQDDAESPVNNMLVIQSGSASFYIEEKQIVTMTYRNDNEYVIYPMDNIPATQTLFLKEFKWFPERRPSRSEVFDRRIRPSVRREKEELPRPSFPLTERILRYRDRLLETGRWADRDELVAYDIQEWIRRNGFEPSAPRKNTGAR